MRSFLEWLLVLAAPLFAAAATAKKSAKTKRAHAPGRPAAVTKKTRVLAKRIKPKAEPKSKGRGAKPDHKSAGKQKEQPALPAKAAAAPTKPAEPAVKPIAPAARPQLLTPENGKYADSVYPKFRWLSVGGANRYEVTWSEHPDLTGSESVNSVATEVSVPSEKPLRVGEIYYWRVRGGNAGGWGPWSSLSSFQVLEGPPPP